MFLSLSFLWNALPALVSLSRSTAMNETLPFHSGASLSQAGSSFAHGLHHDAPNVITFQPAIGLTLNGLPAASTAVSNSARRSPTFSSSANAGAAQSRPSTR